MPMALPNLSAISKQLNSVGALAKAVGPQLFSPTQAPGPTAPQNTSMMRDSYDTGMRPQVSMQDTRLGGSWLNTGLNANTLGFDASRSSTGPYNPFYNPGTQGGTSGGSGSLGAFSGDKAMLNNYDAAFAAAGAQYGIDPNWLKSIAAIEGHYDNSVDQYGAVGIMGIMPGGYGSLEAQYPGWRTDPAQNIALGAAILASKIRENGGTIEGGIQGYLGWGTDAYGTTPGAYLGRVSDYYRELQQGGGQFAGSSGGGDLSSIFSQSAVPDWGEFGAESSNGYYSYGTQYGLNGTQHTGVDVPMPVGSAYRAPMGGIVTCGGTGNGPGANGGGCAAFGDYYGNGAGRVEVLLDNGTVLIFGHSSTSALRPGQRFNPGDILGTSGGMNSPHIHLEARVRDSSTPSGYRIVDPRTVLGGGGAPLGLGGTPQSRGGSPLGTSRGMYDPFGRRNP